MKLCRAALMNKYFYATPVSVSVDKTKWLLEYGFTFLKLLVAHHTKKLTGHGHREDATLSVGTSKPSASVALKMIFVQL